MITLISSKKLGVYRLMKRTVASKNALRFRHILVTFTEYMNYTYMYVVEDFGKFGSPKVLTLTSNISKMNHATETDTT